MPRASIPEMPLFAISTLVLARNGKPSEAKAQYDAVKQLEADSERIAVLINGPLQNTPNDPQIHYEIGMIALRSGLTTEAIRWFTGALAVDPNHLPTHRILASVYHELENPVLSARHRAKPTGLPLSKASHEQ